LIPIIKIYLKFSGHVLKRKKEKKEKKEGKKRKRE